MDEEVRENLLSRMSYNLGLVYQDGGLLVDGMARNLDQDKWDEIAKIFSWFRKFEVAKGQPWMDSHSKCYAVEE